MLLFLFRRQNTKRKHTNPVLPGSDQAYLCSCDPAQYHLSLQDEYAGGKPRTPPCYRNILLRLSMTVSRTRIKKSVNLAIFGWQPSTQQIPEYFHQARRLMPDLHSFPRDSGAGRESLLGMRDIPYQCLRKPPKAQLLPQSKLSQLPTNHFHADWVQCTCDPIDHRKLGE